MIPNTKWVYGITTVPCRRGNLLPQTLESLRKAGFDKPRLFVDGDIDPVSWSKEFHLEVTARHPTIRTFGNWLLGLVELYIREPEVHRYAMFQDDFITYINLRQYLDKCKYPDNGYWNLYTFPSNQSICPIDPTNGKQVEGWFESNQFGRGAVALVFDRKAVIQLLQHQHMIERPLDPQRGWRSIDGGIVTAFTKAGYKEYVHNPSLVQHTGTVSSMQSKPHKLAISFRGEEYNALDLPAK